MRNNFLKILFALFSIFLLAYVSIPGSDFPIPPPDALQSKEPADTETPLRRAYFTNYSREEIMTHYKKQSKLSYVLSYGPEEAQGIIRDQTRSTYLEEIVSPLRESVFINGFEPKTQKDAINIEGKPWKQKVIVRFVPSTIYSRLLVSGLTLALIFVLVREYSHVKKS
jgi:hypothetical protein